MRVYDLGFKLLKFSVGCDIYSVYACLRSLYAIFGHILRKSFATVRCIWNIRTLYDVTV